METPTAHLLIHIESFIIQQFVNNKKRAHITFYVFHGIHCHAFAQNVFVSSQESSNTKFATTEHL